MFKQWIRCETYLSNIKSNHLTEFHKDEQTQQTAEMAPFVVAGGFYASADDVGGRRGRAAKW